MASLQFGIWDSFGAETMSRAPVAADVYREHIAEAKLGEELGYEYYFTIEHQNSAVGQITAPNVFLCALAQHTSRLRIGAMIYQLPMHNPMRLAQEAAMLDHLSQGRLEFGAGLGTHEHEFMRWSLDFAERREMGAEAMDIILKSWSGESVTHQGKFWSYDEALPTPRPFQQPHPPIWYASHSVASLEYAAEHNFNVSQNLDTDEVIAEKFQLFRDSWKQWGHPGPMPRTFLMRAVHVAETDEIARAEAERPLLEADGLGSRGIAETRIGFRGNPDLETRNARARGTREQRATYDWWVDTGVAIIGSPDTVIRKLKEHRASIGYDLFAANHRFGAMTSEAALKSLKLFGEEVIPAFA